VGAWVVEEDVEAPPGVVPVPIVGVSGLGPPPAAVDLARWAAWRWAMPVATLLRAASPDRVVPALPTAPRRPPPAAPGRGAPSPEVALHRLPPAADLLGEVLEMVEGAPGPGSVVVLVPSVGWAERLSERLRRRGVAVARNWAEAAAGWPVVVGARSAAWAPVPTLAGGVVLDAHDESYRRRYDAAAVVAERSRREGAPCRLYSPCPSLVQVEEYGLVRPPRRVERSGWPPVSVVDRRGADPRTGLLSEELVRVRGRPMVCVLNRTGRARLLACAACGALARCERCGRPVERDVDELACRGCGARRPEVCAACGSTRLRVLRQGVSQVRDELTALLGEEVVEVAGPRRPMADAPVLVGTEAALHRVRRAAVVVFLDFDQHLLAPRFTAAEESLALLARAARLVRDGGVVLVQTRLPDHPVLAAAVAADPDRLDERALRRDLRLPPYAALATAGGPTAGEYLAPLGGVDLGDGRWLLRAPDHRALCDALASVVRPSGELRVTVDPTDL
jgi:primosomal protein N' (replication factor Y)